MGKGTKIFFGIFGGIILLLLLGGVWFYLTFYATGPLAVLFIEQGTVQYKSYDGEWDSASSGMKLNQGDSLKTLEDSKAKIILSDSVMRLDAQTEITLDTLNQEKISLTQSVGKTWTRLLKISGIKEYEVSTPNAIATVRGTGFSVDAGEEQTEVKVAEGSVEIDSYKEKAVVEENKEIIIQKDDINLEEKEEDIVKDQWINENLELDAQHLREVKEKYIEKYGFLIEKAQSQYGLTDEQVEELIDGWLAGKYSIQEAIATGTIPPEAVKLIPQELRRY